MTVALWCGFYFIPTMLIWQPSLKQTLCTSVRDTEKKIGTTKRGNGPAYRDKYARTGIRAKDCAELEPFLIDLLPELNQPENYVLCEGAQGFGLDIDWGDYPFVTSSHCTTAGALLNGIPPKALNEVWGVMKCYETYVGAKKFELNNPIFSKIRTIGKEYGATTGRPRQVSWTDMNLVSNAILVNGVTHVVINKMDVLKEVGTWNVFDQNGQVNILSDQEGFQNYFLNFLKEEFPTEGINTHFSSSPEMI